MLTKAHFLVGPLFATRKLTQNKKPGFEFTERASLLL
jgi:hypothetical protein